MKFYQCSHCKNIVAYVQDNGPKVSCCGEEMKELVANTTDAAKEKHVPVVEVNGDLGSPSLSAPSPIPWRRSTTSSGSHCTPSRATSARSSSPARSPRITFAVAPGDQAFGCLRILQPPRPVEGISTYRPLDNGGSFWL